MTMPQPVDFKGGQSFGKAQEMNQGATVEAVCRKLEVSEPTFHRWRQLYGGMKGPEMARLKELEKENARLKKIVAQQVMDIDALKELARKNW